MSGVVSFQSPRNYQIEDDRDVASVKSKHTKSEIDRAAARMVLEWKGEEILDWQPWKH